MLYGNIHSIESMGLVDGPGIRTVVFFQGCSLRCKFCHNPDTWAYDGGTKFTPEGLVKKIRRFKPYFKKNGGVTFSGGEPLMQPDFLLACLKLCHAEGIHTCIDTAGVGLGDYHEILAYTDLVLYDIKHLTDRGYQDLTGNSLEQSLAFLEAMKQQQTKMWIRQVVVPGITDHPTYLENLSEFVSHIPNVEKVELLPYHLLGSNKYEVMGIPNPLADVPAMDQEKTKALQAKYFNGGN